MTSGILLRPRLRLALDKVVDWVEQPTFSRLLLAKPPLESSPEISVMAHAGEPLIETGQNRRQQPYFYQDEWPDLALHSIRFPYLFCLLEGEMDWRIGLTQSMAAALSESQLGYSHFTVGMRAGQIAIIPPGVPYSDGSRFHWNRSEPAHYSVLWMHLLPTGVFCHLSGVSQGERFYHPPLYVHDARVHFLSEVLLEELEGRQPEFEAIARAQLLSMLLRIQRALDEQSLFPISDFAVAWRHESAKQDLRAVLAETDTAVRRACAYIESHLHEPLRTTTVARQALVSPSHLNRLFSAEMGTSVMSHITKRRIEIAQALLTYSQLPIHEIGRQVGYPNSSHFSQVFARETHQSPQNYRNQRHLK